MIPFPFPPLARVGLRIGGAEAGSLHSYSPKALWAALRLPLNPFRSVFIYVDDIDGGTVFQRIPGDHSGNEIPCGSDDARVDVDGVLR